MPAWQMRAYRRTAVFFEGARYFVAGRRRAADGRHVYELAPWGEDLRDIAGTVVHYDRDFVASRDGEAESRARARRVLLGLRPLYPLLGLLPGGVKMRLSDRFGVNEERATVASLYFEAVLALLAATLWTVRVMAASFGGAFGANAADILAELGLGGADLAVVLLAAPDLALRWSRVFGGSSYPWGFWEWLWRREPEAGS